MDNRTVFENQKIVITMCYALKCRNRKAVQPCLGAPSKATFFFCCFLNALFAEGQKSPKQNKGKLFKLKSNGFAKVELLSSDISKIPVLCFQFLV